MNAIFEELRRMHEATAVIVAGVQARAALQDEDMQATIGLIVNGASVRLAEVQSLLKIAAGIDPQFPEALGPLQAEIDNVFEKTMFPSEAITPELALSLDAARLAGMSMLCHLSAAMKRVEKPTSAMRLVVNNDSTGG